MEQRKCDTAMAAKEPVVCETEDSIANHLGLPCQDTGHFVSTPQTLAQISNIITASCERWELPHK